MKRTKKKSTRKRRTMSSARAKVIGRKGGLATARKRRAKKRARKRR